MVWLERVTVVTEVDAEGDYYDYYPYFDHYDWWEDPI
jgi:hypothetical protein